MGGRKACVSVVRFTAPIVAVTAFISNTKNENSYAIETGFYIFTSIQPDAGWKWVGDHLRPRIRVPESWQVPVALCPTLEGG